jgi:hypothetical protein
MFADKENYISKSKRDSKKNRKISITSEAKASNLKSDRTRRDIVIAMKIVSKDLQTSSKEKKRY